MKQGTIKTLGVAALGVAFSAVAAGSASAAAPVGPVESVTTTTATTMGGLPIQQAAKMSPAGGPVIAAADRAVQSGILKSPSQAVDKAVAPSLPPMDAKGNGGLLGGLPLGMLPSNLTLPGSN